MVRKKNNHEYLLVSRESQRSDHKEVMSELSVFVDKQQTVIEGMIMKLHAHMRTQVDVGERQIQAIELLAKAPMAAPTGTQSENVPTSSDVHDAEPEGPYSPNYLV